MRASPKNPIHWNFLKVGSVIAYSFVKNFPKIQECWLASVSLRGLTVKGVYEVSHSRYGQIIVRVCMSVFIYWRFFKNYTRFLLKLRKFWVRIILFLVWDQTVPFLDSIFYQTYEDIGCWLTSRQNSNLTKPVCGIQHMATSAAVFYLLCLNYKTSIVLNNNFLQYHPEDHVQKMPRLVEWDYLSQLL